jgi:hypothetical protein
MARPPINSPDDIIRFVADRLTAEGRPVAPGYEVDFAPLYDGLPTGDPHVRLNEHIDSAQDHWGWIKPKYGSGYWYVLTPAGAARAKEMTVDPDLVERGRRVCASRLGERVPAFQRRYESIQADHAQRGVLHGGLHWSAVSEAVGEEVMARARAAWDVWGQIIRARGAALSDDLGRLAREEVMRAVEESSDDLRKILEAVHRTTGSLGAAPARALAAHIDVVRSVVAADIDLEVLAPASRPPHVGDVHSTVHNVFHGSVAVVQTGAGSTASVTMSSAPGLDAFAAQLERLVALLDASDELAADPAHQVREVARQAITESRKPSPNIIALRGLAFGLATAVQTLGALPAAYQLVKGAAAAVGVQLP